MGTVQAPPSKSMAHRLLMGAGLAKGTSVVKNIELSEDIKATLGILKAFGASYTMNDSVVTVQGIGENVLHTEEILDCRESGSTLRFFLPLALTGDEGCTFSGAPRLMERPLGIYEEICREQGITFEREGTTLHVKGRLSAGHYRVKGNVSSQFITGLLYTLPLLDGESVLEVIPPIESKAYIEMTMQALKTFGIRIRQEGNTYYISGNQSYQARCVTVEGDYSNAAFLDALNVIGGDVNIEGLVENSLQGDKIYARYFELLQKENALMDIAECPDLGPILMGVAAALNGAIFTGTRRLKIKESDRGTVMAQELAKFGIRVEVFENEIIVHKGILKEPEEMLSSHNDHRIAMTMATLCTITGGSIEGAESVRKSYPTYYDVIEKLGIKIEREEQ